MISFWLAGAILGAVGTISLVLLFAQEDRQARPDPGKIRCLVVGLVLLSLELGISLGGLLATALHEALK